MLTQDDLLKIAQVVQSETRKTVRSEIKVMAQKEIRKVIREEFESEMKYVKSNIISLARAVSELGVSSRKNSKDIILIKKSINKISKDLGNSFAGY